MQIALVVGLDVVLQVSQQIVLLNSLADVGQASIGRLYTAGMASLHSSETVGVGPRLEQLQALTRPFDMDVSREEWAEDLRRSTAPMT